jgi:hypothetical protein
MVGRISIIMVDAQPIRKKAIKCLKAGNRCQETHL